MVDPVCPIRLKPDLNKARLKFAVIPAKLGDAARD
jgi:hypothetical protein